MQYLKEEIKNRITAAALNEFKDKGFSEASMRRIARSAGVALGNVYRYFKNKDELFGSIMEPVYSQFTSLVLNVAKDGDMCGGPQTVSIKDIVEKVMEVFKKYSTEFLIMIDKSKGSKYENIKEELVRIIDSRLKEELIPQVAVKSGQPLDDLMTYIIASATVDGVLTILRNRTDADAVNHMVGQLLIFIYDDIQKRLYMPH